MVYYADTLELCHPIDDKTRELYLEMLEREADRILFKHQHPFKYFV